MPATTAAALECSESGDCRGIVEPHSLAGGHCGTSLRGGAGLGFDDADGAVLSDEGLVGDAANIGLGDLVDAIDDSE